MPQRLPLQLREGEVRKPGASAAGHRDLAQHLVHRCERAPIARPAPVPARSLIQVLQQRTRVRQTWHSLLLGFSLPHLAARQRAFAHHVLEGRGEMLLEAPQRRGVLLLLRLPTERPLHLFCQAVQEERNIMVGRIHRTHHAVIEPIFEDPSILVWQLHPLSLQPSLKLHSRRGFSGEHFLHRSHDTFRGAAFVLCDGQGVTLRHSHHTAVGEVGIRGCTLNRLVKELRLFWSGAVNLNARISLIHRLSGKVDVAPQIHHLVEACI
mmetsp:Transcript_112272/g.267648  ORF Transcript_112272/g.267648 Transcript_112272/m.267648 type:complete len:266 (-) Transcript_112272:253-1050(-)